MMKSVYRKAFFVCIVFVLYAVTGMKAQESLLLRSNSKSIGDLVIDEAMKHLGTPYRWGGKTPKGFDCAGFTRYVYSKFGVSLAPSAAPQYKTGVSVKREDLSKGDLVFFGGRHSSRSIGHVGIVVSADAQGGFTFIHASSSKGITITSSSDAYYRSRYISACRLMDKVDKEYLPKDGPSPNDVPIYRRGLFSASTVTNCFGPLTRRFY